MYHVPALRRAPGSFGARWRPLASALGAWWLVLVDCGWKRCLRAPLHGPKERGVWAGRAFCGLAIFWGRQVPGARGDGGHSTPPRPKPTSMGAPRAAALRSSSMKKKVGA
jgi:hypothetical protein